MTYDVSQPHEATSGGSARPSMALTRRTITMLVCGALLIGMLLLALLLPVPYVSLQPGPTENTLGSFDGVDVIVIEGEETFPTEGNLDLTTVSVTSADSELNLIDAIWDWADPTRAVVPREDIYPEQDTPEEVRARNAEQMVTSQENAIAAALRELDYPVADSVVVLSIEEGAPALDRLRAGDVVLAVDGEEVVTIEDVQALIEAHTPGEEVAFTVERDGSPMEIQVPTIESPNEAGRTIVGIQPGMGYDFPFDVTITLGEDIGGPSAGLMFSLGIVDKLTEGALTGGEHIAGTGTIGGDGLVGPIGGIQQKIAGAKEAGATVFLVPAANCASAIQADVSGITLVRVESLAGAVEAIEAVTAGQPAPACS